MAATKPMDGEADVTCSTATASNSLPGKKHGVQTPLKRDVSFTPGEESPVAQTRRPRSTDVRRDSEPDTEAREGSQHSP